MEIPYLKNSRYQPSPLFLSTSQGLEIITVRVLECLPYFKSSMDKIVVRLKWLVVKRGRKRRKLAFSQPLLVTVTAPYPCEVSITTRWKNKNETIPRDLFWPEVGWEEGQADLYCSFLTGTGPA